MLSKERLNEIASSIYVEQLGKPFCVQNFAHALIKRVEAESEVVVIEYVTEDGKGVCTCLTLTTCGGGMMISREEVIEIAKQRGDDWDSTLNSDKEFIVSVCQAAYRQAVEDSASAVSRWIRFMDQSKRAGIHPTVFEDWRFVEVILKLLEE